MASSRDSSLATERLLCEIWAETLAVPVRPYDDFFDLGGDSLKVVAVVIAVRQHGFALRSSAVFRHPTPARLAEHLTLDAGGDGLAPPLALVPASASTEPDSAAEDPRAVPIVRGGEGEPVFFVHSDHGTGFERATVGTWTDGRPVYGFAPPGSASPGGGRANALPEMIGSLAARYVDALRRIRPEGSCTLAGAGSGAVVAFEMARLLRADACNVTVLAMIKPWLPGRPQGTEPKTFDEALVAQLSEVTGRFGLTEESTSTAALATMREQGWYDDGTRPGELPARQAASAALALAVHDYRPSVYDGPVVLVQDTRDAEATEEVWGPVVPDCRAHWFAYGLRSLRPLLTDPEVADIIRAEFAL